MRQTNAKLKIKLSLVERLKPNESNFKDTNLNGEIFFKKVTKNNRYVEAKTNIAKILVFTSIRGILAAVKYTNNIEMLFVKESCIKKCFFDQRPT